MDADPLDPPKVKPIPSSATAQYVRTNKDELRMQAAATWIDMEEAGESPSKNSVSKRMGFSGTQSYIPVFLKEPEFTHAVEFERVRRMSQGAGVLTKEQISLYASFIARSGLLETARRFVTEPGKIPLRDLLPETRNYARLAADVDPTAGSNVSLTINNFFEAAGRLPMKARIKVLRMYDEEIKQLSLTAGKARDKIEAVPVVKGESVRPGMDVTDVAEVDASDIIRPTPPWVMTGPGEAS